MYTLTIDFRLATDMFVQLLFEAERADIYEHDLDNLREPAEVLAEMFFEAVRDNPNAHSDLYRELKLADGQLHGAMWQLIPQSREEIRRRLFENGFKDMLISTEQARDLIQLGDEVFCCDPESEDSLIAFTTVDASIPMTYDEFEKLGPFAGGF